MVATKQLSELYETDEVAWYEENAKLIRKNKFELIDIKHIAEHLEDMGRREKNELLTRAIELLMHLLKWKYQPERQGVSWEKSIREQRRIINIEIKTSTNLKKYLNENYAEAYKEARYYAAEETHLPLKTFPSTPPFSISEVLKIGFFP